MEGLFLVFIFHASASFLSGTLFATAAFSPNLIMKLPNIMVDWPCLIRRKSFIFEHPEPSERGRGSKTGSVFFVNLYGLIMVSLSHLKTNSGT